MSGADNTMTKDNDNLQANILQELKKTGFPTEVISAEVMQKHDWGVIHSPSYWDESEKISREFDLRAYRNWKYNAKNRDASIGVYLIVECKKSEKPWVFFSTPEVHRSWEGQFIKATDKFIFTNMHRHKSAVSDDDLANIHHYFGGSIVHYEYLDKFLGILEEEHSEIVKLVQDSFT